jgi:hypothetical protein
MQQEQQQQQPPSPSTSSSNGSAGVVAQAAALEGVVGGPNEGHISLKQGHQGDVWKELYRHQRQLEALKAENKALKRAFCIIHPKEAFCRRGPRGVVGVGSDTE